MSSSQIVAGGAVVRLGVQDQLSRGLEAASQRLKAFGAKATRFGGAMSAAGLALLGPSLAGIAKFSDAGDELSKLADRTGLAVEALSELRHAASQSDVPVEQLQAGLVKMNKVLGEAFGGSASAQESLAELGLTVAQLQGLEPDRQFELLAEAISRIQDPAQRTATAMGIFGKGAANLAPMFTTGADGIRQLREEARRLGLQVSGADAAAATKFGDTWANLQTVVGDIFFELGAAIAGALTVAVELVTPVVVAFSEWINQNRELVALISYVGSGLLATGGAIIALGTLINITGAALGGLMPVITVIASTVSGWLTAAFVALTSPIGLVVAGVVGLGVAAQQLFGIFDPLFKWMSDGWNFVYETFVQTWKGVKDALAAGDVGLAFEIVFTSIKLAVTTAMESVLNTFGGTISEMSKLLAELYKQIGYVVGRLNEARVSVVNWLSEQMGNAVGIDTSIERQFAAEQAAAWTQGFEQIDTSALGKSIENALDPDTYKQQLNDLVNQAAEARVAADAEYEKQKRATPELPDFDIDTSRSMKESVSFATVGSFGAAMLGRMMPGSKSATEQHLSIAKQQLKAAERTNNILDELSGPVFGP